MADLVGDHDDRFRQPASSNDPISQPSGLSTRKKRSGYIPQACINCRKRKVKCSGGLTCTECSKAGETCLYTERRRKRRSDVHHSPRSQRWHSFEDDSTTTELSNHVIDMTARLSNLERHYSQLRTVVDPQLDARRSHSVSSQLSSNAPAQEQEQVHKAPVAATTTATAEPMAVSVPVTVAVTAPAPQDDFSGLAATDIVDYALDGSTSLPGGFTSLPVNDLLQQDKTSRPQERANGVGVGVGVGDGDGDSDTGVIGALEGLLPPGPSPVMSKDIDPCQAERAVRINNGAFFRASFDIFFRRLNPLHPLLNENQFRAQFDSFVFDQGRDLSELDQSQLLALVNLIHAEVEILTGDCSDTDAICGWREFCTADSILQDLIWKGKANLMTVQCLLLKARYLLYLERFNQAYDIMGTAVRICMQLGLHDQSRWAAHSFDPFETVMRQRVFYSLFTLERAVSLSCGLPPSLRPSEFCVDMPPALDDRGLFPHRPLPDETPEHSFVPYFVAVIRWAELCGDIWDTMLYMGAPKPVSDSQIASLDAKILEQIRAVPRQLQWETEGGSSGSGGGGGSGNKGRMDSYVWRQKVMYRVRMNAMRLRIRQDRMSRLSFNNHMADEVVKIAASSIETLKDSLRTSADATDRYFSTMYLVGVITPLSCIIVKDDTLPTVRAETIALWKDAVHLLQEIARDFDLARRLLQRFHGVIKMADLIVVAQSQGNGHSSGCHPALPELPNEAPDGDGDDGGTACLSTGAQPLMEHQHVLFPLSHLPTPAAGNDLPFGGGGGSGMIFDSDYWMGTTW